MGKIRTGKKGKLRHGKRRRGGRNYYGVILCGLVFFVLSAGLFCMVSDSREAKAQKEAQAAQLKAEEEKRRAEAERERLRIEAEEAAKRERQESLSLRPGVPVGTFEEGEEKVVYLTFDDGPSANTQKVLDILDRFDAKATFFITAQYKDYLYMAKTAYEKGHTIGLHTYSHDYAEIYSSTDAYFKDLEKIGKAAEEQIGFVPCFIRFPGGASNTVSRKYTQGIMTELSKQVVDKGYQYYDWNVSSGDGGVVTADEIVEQSETDKLNQIILLFHDTPAKDSTVEALPKVLQYYKDKGYVFRAIDRKSVVVQHRVNN